MVVMELQDPNEKLQKALLEQASLDFESEKICLAPARLTTHGHYSAVSISGTVKAVENF